jgi:uncharacterized repeat protein (TIGR02543 family)
MRVTKFKQNRALVALSSALAIVFAVIAPTGQAAQAVTNYTVTVVSTGGSTEGTNWTFANGEIVPSATVAINASDIEAKLLLGSVVLNGDKILVNANLVTATANALNFKSTGNIIVGGGVTVQTAGGDIVFNADSDANATGHVRFGLNGVNTAGTISSGGGRIIVGGGANPLTTATAAQNNDAPSTGSTTPCLGGTPPISGVGIYAFTFNSGSGDISIRGGSPNLGAISTRSINIGSCSWGTTTFVATGAGNIYLFGDGSQIAQNNAWGIATASMNFSTQAGNITLEGRGNPSGPTNARGMSIGGATTFTSVSGNVRLVDTTSGAIAGYTGINLGAAISVTTAGTFRVEADEISQGGALTIAASSAYIGAYNTASFTNVYSTGVINAANTPSLTIGAPGNTSAITLGGAVTSGGVLNVNGSAVTINAAVTAPTAITFTTSAGVTQNSTISTASVNLAGTATYTPSAFTVTGGSAARIFAVTFDTQGGTAVSTTTFAVGAVFALPSAPTKAGMVFAGWFESAVGGSALVAPYTPAATADMTLYAQWSLPDVRWQTQSAANLHPQLNSVVGGTAVAGSSVFVRLSGYNLDLATEISSSSGNIKVISKSPSELVLEISGASVGRGSLTFTNQLRSLRLDSAFTILAEQPVLRTAASFVKVVTIGFGNGSTKVTQSGRDKVAYQVSDAAAGSTIVITGSTSSTNPTKADRALALARAKAVGALVAKAVPGAAIRYEAVVVKNGTAADRAVTVAYSVKQQ